VNSTGLASSLFLNKSKLMFAERITCKSHTRSSRYFFSQYKAQVIAGATVQYALMSGWPRY
jgi:hypothetical protein